MNRLKELRKKNKTTQKEIANLLGVSEMTISRWEKETELSIKHEYINKLSDYFNVSVPELLGYELPEVFTPREEKIQDLYIETIKNKDFLTYYQFEQIYKSHINDDLFELLVNFTNSPKEVQDNIRILLRYAVASKYTDNLNKSKNDIH